MTEEERKKVVKKTKGERKIEKELLYIVGFMAALVVIFLIASAVFRNMNSIEYEGLEFQKERIGELYFYHASYYFKSVSGDLVQYNLFVRNNPLENNIPVEGNINFVGNLVYVTLDTSYLRDCQNTEIAIPDLVRYLRDNQLFVKSGNMDFTEAAVYDQEYVTCETHPQDNVIQLRRGNETKIYVNGFCSDISIGEDCKVLEAVEKYKVQAFVDAQKRN